jgi:hypothetical protein
MGRTQDQQKAREILDEVYGPWTTNWKPKPFERTAPRYLWTDAFGVCTYLTLYNSSRHDPSATDDRPRLLQQAVALAEDVHSTLGHVRPDSELSKSGSSSSSATAWLQGADAEHPTRAGLRIGKPHPEGHPDGDGQYFHYLTKWAFALNQLARATQDSKYLRFAVELMQTAHRAFTHKTPSGMSRMCWKMSIDLTHPTVSSMGNLDSYDGLVTCTLLQQAAAKTLGGVQAVTGQGSDTAWLDQGSGSKVLQQEIADFQAMVDSRYPSYTSDDPLDLGEALWLSHWQLGTVQPAAGGAAWARHLYAVSTANLGELWSSGYFDQPLRWRLGFREFGTSIGLQALLGTQLELPDADLWAARVQQIHDTWADNLYTRDRDITPVMYVTSLDPGVWV